MRSSAPLQSLTQDRQRHEFGSQHHYRSCPELTKEQLHTVIGFESCLSFSSRAWFCFPNKPSSRSYAPVCTLVQAESANNLCPSPCSCVYKSRFAGDLQEWSLQLHSTQHGKTQGVDTARIDRLMVLSSFFSVVVHGRSQLMECFVLSIPSTTESLVRQTVSRMILLGSLLRVTVCLKCAFSASWPVNSLSQLQFCVFLF